MVIVLIAMLVLGYVIYYNMPAAPIALIERGSKDKVQHVNYGDTPVFWENLRFAKDKITYYIEPTCTEKRTEKMKEAFDIWSEQTGAVTFYSASFQDADIMVGCSKDYVKLDKRLFLAGEGGPSQVINTSNFKIIQNGKIVLFRSSDCKYPVVEIHELAHVFGFDHSQNPTSIMYNTSDCSQRITPDMIRIIRELYAVPSLPDLRIAELSGVTKGRYLDFNISINNEGLSNAENVYLKISVEGDVFEEIEMELISVGNGRILSAENILMPTRNPEKIRFEVDPDNVVKEINEKNNVLELTSSK